MATITLKGIPDDLYERIKESATANRRSVNREVIVRLERSLGSKRVDPAEQLARVDALRDRLALPPLNDELLKLAKGAGRP
jgi:plasmid stability protein